MFPHPPGPPLTGQRIYARTLAHKGMRWEDRYRVGVTHHLVGLAELAEMLGVGVQQANRLSRRPDFPAPQARLKAGTIWLREDVERWIAERGERRPGRPRRHPE